MIKKKGKHIRIKGTGIELKLDLAGIVYALHRDFAEVSSSEKATTAICRSMMAAITQAVKDERGKDDL